MASTQITSTVILSNEIKKFELPIFNGFKSINLQQRNCFPNFHYCISDSIHCFHSGFHGNCFQSKSLKIRSLPLKSGFSTNGVIVLSSIMATKSTLEITRMKWKEKKKSVNSLWVNLNIFSFRKKNNTHKNCFKKGFRDAIMGRESVYMQIAILQTYTPLRRWNRTENSRLDFLQKEKKNRLDSESHGETRKMKIERI